MPITSVIVPFIKPFCINKNKFNTDQHGRCCRSTIESDKHAQNVEIIVQNVILRGIKTFLASTNCKMHLARRVSKGIKDQRKTHLVIKSAAFLEMYQ